jgi:putative phosphoribosyl transferase
VLGLARGGVVVAHELARAVGAPLDVLVVRKLGAPGQPELAMGAVASGGGRALNPIVIDRLGVSPEAVSESARRELEELAVRERAYRGTRSPPQLAGRTVILVDDGLATGASMRAAVASVRAAAPASVRVAVPVGAPDTVADIRTTVDELVCLLEPDDFMAVGEWYDEFDPVDDATVRRLLS